MPMSGGTAGAHDDSMHQGNAKRDVAEGVGGLDASGFLLAKGAGIMFPRSGSDDVHIYERTSGEEAYAFHRTGANDYTFFIKESNIWKRFQTESMKDIANGIAGLNAGKVQVGSYSNPMRDEYSNHLGAVDNYTEINVYGNGTANTDAANHEMDLSTGVGAVSGASFNEKSGFVLSTSPHIFTALVQNLVNGAGGNRLTYLGFAETYPAVEHGHNASFICIPDGSWVCGTYEGVTPVNTNISPLANGDLITIMATSSAVRFFVNGVLVATHTTSIPTTVMEIVASVYEATGAVSTARSISIDLMGVKRYV